MDANPPGPSDQRAVEALLWEFDRNRPERQEEVIESLSQMGVPAVSGLIQRLNPATELKLWQLGPYSRLTRTG